jgi:predicted NUDIX family phosphoesterase
LRLLGTINDDSTEVGQVHLGLAFLLESDSPQFEVNEKELMTAEWADVDQINNAFDRMESWSQILVKNCIQKNA